VSSSEGLHYDQIFVAVHLEITCLGSATNIDLRIAFSFGLVENLLVRVVDTFDFTASINHFTVPHFARITASQTKATIIVVIADSAAIGNNPFSFFPRVFSYSDNI